MAKSLHSNAWRELLTELLMLRLTAKLTQQEIATRLGRTQSFVSKIERGERRLDVLEFVEWVLILDGDPADVISRLIKDR